ncbi:2-oxoglutarate ferredoxin oxidoreductase subunit beta [Balnearium lithotrophicum]|uniref:2-oxoglutarate ferredoxin oxidoreductase subunit beta n=1 Tax=Balnearium lithotrophicum TaxID=223788 RepID=A0A521DCC8_9BACT|nr:thiamine pyrophosphate-dependent enzyme [Balnearium lithotrophicum]SMO69248.1 2-oxoglutarate ferredoxin oxidoreductase subunit beta [Balnearium lithotrophicum]
MLNLKTKAEITWCPGCGNFGILKAFESAVNELSNEVPVENFVIASGIGCHGKIVDYINLNSFYSIHGRALSNLEGMRLVNDKLVCVGFVGDGDIYAEGVSHLIFAAKRNVNITAIVHDNRSYSLTTGQFTPTSPSKFKGKSTPEGPPEDPINPLLLMLSSGATFVARGFAGDIPHLTYLIKEAIKHKGFSFIDVLQPCVTFFNTFPFYRKHCYKLEEVNHDVTNFELAVERAKEWDYNDDSEDVRIPIGIFYRVEKPTYEERVG